MSNENELTPEEMFLKYDYPETKDMCKQFLTLITTVLVISLTFSDKIVGFSSATTTSKWLVITAWTSFLLAIIFCGLGLLFVTIAAGQAAYSKTINGKRVSDAYKMIVAAGGLFILGLVLLIGTAVVTTYNNTTTTSQKPTGNNTIAIDGVSCTANSFVVTESELLRMNICGKKADYHKSAN